MTANITPETKSLLTRNRIRAPSRNKPLMRREASAKRSWTNERGRSAARPGSLGVHRFLARVVVEEGRRRNACLGTRTNARGHYAVRWEAEDLASERERVVR